MDDLGFIFADQNLVPVCLFRNLARRKERETGLGASQTLVNSIALKITNDACFVCFVVVFFLKGHIFLFYFLDISSLASGDG